MVGTSAATATRSPIYNPRLAGPAAYHIFPCNIMRPGFPVMLDAMSGAGR